ncbi:hypothetical protein [Enterococcus sp. AZ007]|uniref:hypothetical protein n=1 Tax=Enterococcus sp. AZ007 TaxID=2774839 RepID=UPI003F249891
MKNISTAFKFNESDAKLISQFLVTKANQQMDCFLSVEAQLTDYAYWYLLTTMWINESTIYPISAWKKLFFAKRANRLVSIMKPNELTLFKKLSNKLILYRAHSKNETDWISYTLDLETAVKFAKMKNVDEVVEYKIKKHDCYALFLRREESEILCLNKDLAKKIRSIKVD